MPVDHKGGKPEKDLKKHPPQPTKSKSESLSKTSGAAKVRPAPRPKPVASRPTPAASPPASKAAFVALDQSANAAEVGEEIQALGARINELVDDVALNYHRDAMADLDGGVADLVDEVTRIRERGYVYKSFLEAKLATLQQKWEEVRPRLERELDQQAAELGGIYNQAAEEYNRAVGLGARASSRLAAVRAKVDNLESRVSSAASALNAIYSNVRDTYYQTRGQVSEVTWLLDALDESPLELLATENPIQAVKAHWWRDGKKDGPEGVLYLTDQRLLFEQKEKVATKKVLFVTTESEMVQELLMAVPITGVESCASSHKGLGGHQDHLDFEFSEGDFVNAHFHLQGQDSDRWAALIKRVLNAEIQRERFYPEGTVPEAVAAEEEAVMAEAPASCESCGAPLDAEIVRGQRSIECEYCGTVMRW